ncbi:MAG: hypothetical protein IJY45_06555, partial [Tidjanibacter sp.]|nr:hypothetical protein [Tidjanibacter sp.]
MKNKLNIFIAGSKALEKERNLFKIVAQDLQLDYANHKKKNIHISVTTFESFSSIFTSKETLQDVYNKYIREESDVVFFVFDGTIGGITKDEFEVAESAYKDSKNNKPKLCVFTKENTEINLEIENLKQRVNDIGQYWVDYANEDELRRKIYIELSRQVDELVFKKPWYKRILPYFIVAVLLSSLMVVSKLLQKPIEPVYSYDIQVIDELLTNGRLIVNKDSTDVIKYRISTEDTPVVNWNDKSIPYLTSRDTIYPKDNCIIKVYG